MTAWQEVLAADARLREAQIAAMVAELRALAREVNDYDPGRGRHALWLIGAWERDEDERAKLRGERS